MRNDQIAEPRTKSETEKIENKLSEQRRVEGATVSRTLEEKQAELKNVETAILEGGKKVQGASNELNEVLKNIAQKTADSATLSREVKRKDEEKEQALKELTDIQNQHEGLVKICSDLDDKKKATEKNVDDAVADERSRINQETSVDNEILLKVRAEKTSIEEEIIETKKKILTLTENHDKKVGEFDLIMRQVDDLKTKFTALEAEVNEKKNETEAAIKRYDLEGKEALDKAEVAKQDHKKAVEAASDVETKMAAKSAAMIAFEKKSEKFERRVKNLEEWCKKAGVPFDFK